MTMAEGIETPAVSQIAPFMVARGGACAKRKFEHNKSNPRRQSVFLILIKVGCGKINIYVFTNIKPLYGMIAN
jgi:hypothetical protein